MIKRYKKFSTYIATHYWPNNLVFVITGLGLVTNRPIVVLIAILGFIILVGIKVSIVSEEFRKIRFKFDIVEFLIKLLDEDLIDFNKLRKLEVSDFDDPECITKLANHDTICLLRSIKNKYIKNNKK